MRVKRVEIIEIISPPRPDHLYSDRVGNNKALEEVFTKRNLIVNGTQVNISSPVILF